MRCKQDYTVAYENGLLDIPTVPLILKFPGLKVKATGKMLLFVGNRDRLKFTYCPVAVGYTFVRFLRIIIIFYIKSRNSNSI